jgi:hypothetical protein
MNEAMKNAWVEITRSFGEPTREELDVFLRTWQMAIEAEREACAKVCEEAEVVQTTYCMTLHDEGAETLRKAAAAIRARSLPRGQA